MRGVGVSGFSVEFDWREPSLTLSTLLSRLNEYALSEAERGFVVVSFDEAQLLRFLAGGKGRWTLEPSTATS